MFNPETVITLIVNAGLGREVRYSQKMPSILVDASRPLRTTDVPIFGTHTNLSDEIMVHSQAAQNAVDFRQSVADELGQKFAELLLEHMKSEDTHNGYKKSN